MEVCRRCGRLLENCHCFQQTHTALHVHPYETLTVQMFEVHLVRRCVRMLQVHRQTFLASMLSPVAVKSDNMYVPANKERINYKILHERILAVFGFVFLIILICSSNIDSL